MNEDELIPAPADIDDANWHTPDFGSMDYLLLPDTGRYHYSLEDASLLAACDWWTGGRIEGFPASDDWPADVDAPEVRKNLEPTRIAIRDLLLRSVEKGICEAEVMGRDASNSAPLPARTFITLDQLVDCLELHGHSSGDFLSVKIQEESESRQDFANAVAYDRAALRHAHQMRERSEIQPNVDEAEALRELLKAKNLQITHLQLQLLSGPQQQLPKKLSTREKNTLLLIIAAACKSAGLDHKRWAKNAAILCDSANDLGVSLGESTIESHLKSIPDLLTVRSKPTPNKGS